MINRDPKSIQLEISSVGGGAFGRCGGRVGGGGSVAENNLTIDLNLLERRPMSFFRTSFENPSVKEGRSTINLMISGTVANSDPGPFVYVRPVGDLEDYLC